MSERSHARARFAGAKRHAAALLALVVDALFSA
jgi:hypothetical protein